MDRKSTSPGEFAQHCERLHREWHDRAKARDTEGLLALYATEAVLESPLVPAILDGKSDGVLRGHAELRHFFRRVRHAGQTSWCVGIARASG